MHEYVKKTFSSLMDGTFTCVMLCGKRTESSCRHGRKLKQPGEWDVCDTVLKSA